MGYPRDERPQASTFSSWEGIYVAQGLRGNSPGFGSGSITGFEFRIRCAQKSNVSEDKAGDSTNLRYEQRRSSLPFPLLNMAYEGFVNSEEGWLFDNPEELG